MSKKPTQPTCFGPLTSFLVAGLVASGILAPAAIAAPGIVISKDLRGAPSTAAPVVDELDAGTPQRFVLRRGQWLAVNHAGGLAWVQAVQGLDGDDVKTAREDNCLDGSDTVTPRPHDRVKVTEATRLRARLGHNSERDLKLSRGTKVWVHASEQGGAWLLVEDPRGHQGWVRGCDVEGVARHAGDRVEVTRAGDLLSGTNRDAQKIMALSNGDRLTVVNWSKDWVKLTATDGLRGWYPVEWIETVDEGDPNSLWQPGLVVKSTCAKSAAPDKGSPSSIRCGDRLRIVRATGTEKQPRLLVVSDDGRWGWIDEPVTPIAIGEAVVADDVRPRIKNDNDSVIVKVTPAAVERDAMAGMKMGRNAIGAMKTGHDTKAEVKTGHDEMAEMKMGDDAKSEIATAPDGTPEVTDNGEPTALARKEMGHEAMMGMGMGDMSAPTDGAAMSMSFQTAFPVGDAMTDDPMMMRTPRYEVSVSATGSGRLGGGFDFGLTATFSAAGSLSADGQMRHEEYQGGQASLTVSHGLGEDSKISLGGGYSLAFHSPGDMAGSEWDFIAIHPGPFGRLALAGQLTQRLSYSVRGTAQLSQDSDGMSSSILMADAMAMLSLNSWLTAGLNGMAMKMAMGDTMVAAGPSLSVAFFKRFSGTVAVTAMSSGGMTMWTTTTGLGVHF